jgi:hypothetical protein
VEVDERAVLVEDDEVDPVEVDRDALCGYSEASARTGRRRCDGFVNAA